MPNAIRACYHFQLDFALGPARTNGPTQKRSFSTASPPSQSDLRPVVIGGSIFDLVTSVDESNIVLNGSTHQGSVKFGLGGVGRNLADALASFDQNPMFISAVGKDDLGKNILSKTVKQVTLIRSEYP